LLDLSKIKQVSRLTLLDKVIDFQSKSIISY
jgi:hypothetical protein